MQEAFRGYRDKGYEQGKPVNLLDPVWAPASLPSSSSSSSSAAAAARKFAAWHRAAGVSLPANTCSHLLQGGHRSGIETTIASHRSSVDGSYSLVRQDSLDLDPCIALHMHLLLG